MMEYLLPILVPIAAYFVGSLSFAVVVSRAMGLADPRTFGSKNPGATNVLRSGNKVAAIATLFLDVAKACLPLWAVLHWGRAYGLGDVTVAMVGLAVFLGHLYPIFFHFKGGKGVASAAGVLLGINPWLAAVVAFVWLVTLVGWRYSSLASLVAAVVAPVLYVLGGGEVWSFSPILALSMTVMSALLVFRHHENIGRLLKGTESKLFSNKKSH